jgi:hypothetical protein
MDSDAILRSCAAQFEETLHRAARTSGIKQDHFFAIAGRRVKLTFTSTALAAQLTPALEHVRVEPGAADLEVGLWEGADEPAPPLPAAWEQARYFPRGRVPGMEHPNLRLVVFPGLGSLSLVDLASNRGWYCATEAARVTYWESAAPLRNLLHAWLARRGAFVLHGAAIGTEHGAVLLVGRGGSGKSTTSLLGVTAGMHYLGDDCCLGEMLNGQPFVHAFYSSAKVCNDALPRLNGFHARLGNPNRLPEEKAVFFLAGTHDSQLPQRLPLGAILLPQVTVDRPVRMERVSPGMALAALSPSTMMQLADADQHDLAFHAALVKSVPAFRLSLNGDHAAILDTMKGLLA